MLPTLLGAALLLLPSDQAALRGSRLLPHASNAVAAGLGIRPAVLDTVTYATLPPGVTTVVLDYTFPAGVIQAGNQMRYRVYGHMSDTLGSNLIVVRSVVTQLTSRVSAGVTPSTTAFDVAFVIEGAFSFSQPGAPGRGVVAPGKAAPGYVGGAQDSLIVGSMVSFIQTDPGLNTASQRGGGILTDNPALASNGLSQMVTNNDANTFYLVGGQPIEISLSIAVPPSVTMTLQGGWLEAM